MAHQRAARRRARRHRGDRRAQAPRGLRRVPAGVRRGDGGPLVRPRAWATSSRPRASSTGSPPRAASRFPRRLGLVGLVAVAAAWVLILAIGRRHRAARRVAAGRRVRRAAPGAGRGQPERRPARALRRLSSAVPSAALDDLAAPYSVPSSIDAAYDRLAAYDSDDAAAGAVLRRRDGGLGRSSRRARSTGGRCRRPARGSTLGGSEAWVGRATVGGGRPDRARHEQGRPRLHGGDRRRRATRRRALRRRACPSRPSTRSPSGPARTSSELGRRFGFGATLAPGE